MFKKGIEKSKPKVCVFKELRLQTLQWMAVREIENLDVSESDRFMGQLYEILVKGNTDHRFIDAKR